MIKNFSGISVAGIIVPGEIYVLSEVYDRVWNWGALKYMFFIKEESEVLSAIEMEFFIVLAGAFKRIRFLGMRKIDEDCHQFRFECVWKGSMKRRMCPLYLHRVPSFPEYLNNRKKRFSE